MPGTLSNWCPGLYLGIHTGNLQVLLGTAVPVPYQYPQPTGHEMWVTMDMGFVRGHIKKKIHVINYLTTIQAGSCKHLVSGPKEMKKNKKKKTVQETHVPWARNMKERKICRRQLSPGPGGVLHGGFWMHKYSHKYSCMICSTIWESKNIIYTVYNISL
jgi:hypothetical protein